MKKILLSIAAAACLSAAVFADEASDVMKISTNLPVPDYSQSTLIMDLFDKTGKMTEHRIIKQYGNNKNDLVQTVFDITTPKAVKDTRILQAEKRGKSDDKWIYMPQLKQTRRIATQERKKSFVGSEFTYNDMTIRHFEDDAYEMLDANSSQPSNGGKNYACWKIKCTPIQNKNVEYAYRYVWVEKESHLPIFVEYYDKKDKMIKTYRIEKFEKTVVGSREYWMRLSNYVVNLETGCATRVIADSYVFDKPISDRYFTQNWLNTGK